MPKKRINISIKEPLLERADERARNLGMTRSGYLQWLAKRDIKKGKQMTDGITSTSTQKIVDQAHSETQELRLVLKNTQELLEQYRAELRKMLVRLEDTKKLTTSALNNLAEEKEKSERINTAIISYSNETLQDEITGRQAVEAILLLCAEAEKPDA